MDDLTHAKFYATYWHVTMGKKLYGVLPYTHHCAEVERVLRDFGEEDQNVIVGSWLHDLIEDTPVKRRDIEENFGEAVADIVWAVTDEEVPGGNRSARKALTYPKTRAAGASAIRLKLADRIANISNGLEVRNFSMVKKYAKEYPDFRHALYDASHDFRTQSMWKTLDRLMAEAGWKR
jgi:(p)ppGpp synthase/HD superfamily hydrolase